MPRRARGRRRRSHGGELTVWDEFNLEFGPPFILGFEYERAVELWGDFAESFMADWIEKHPGRRPWAWWEFEAPEPRRVLNPLDPLTVARFPDHQLIANEQEMRRCPGQVLVGHTTLTGGLVPWLEEERDYLSRLGLLVDGELDRIPGEPPRPGSVYDASHDDESVHLN